MMWLVLQSILFISALRVCSIDNFWSILFCLSNVWSLLHHRSVAESRIKSVIYVLIHFFWHFLLLFIVRFVFCIIFISFLIEVSNFHNKIFKVVSPTFLLVWFSSLKESFCETRKNVFCHFKSCFCSPEIQSLEFLDVNFWTKISWRHKMLQYQTSNTFYWITWKINTVS